MHIRRNLKKIIIKHAKKLPVVTLTGPRQSGKTTLVRHAFPEKPYVSFENLDTRQLFKEDPRGFLKQYQNGAIFDEFQLVPELPSYLQQIVDENNQPGLFILTGSQQLEIMSQVSQSLAGRSAVLKLLPFSIKELRTIDTYDADDLILNGFYPRIYDQNIEPQMFYQSYFDTYIQRDLLQLISINQLDLFQKFVVLCAGRIGNVFVASNLANELGVSVPTVQSWLSILQASYVVYLLQPYYKNFNKRITKAPKLYFYDVGLAAYLLNIRDKAQLFRDPSRGGLFENLVIMDAIKFHVHRGDRPHLYFYRDRNQNEVDLIWEQGHELTGIEIKSSETYHSSMKKGLDYFRKTCPFPNPKNYVVYRGDSTSSLADTQLLSYKNVETIFK